MTGPFFTSQEEKIKDEKVVRKFLGGGIKEMKKELKKIFFRKNKSRNIHE